MMTTLTLRVRFAWWLKPYFYGLAAMSAITGCEPDWVRVTRYIDRAVRVDGPRKQGALRRCVSAIRRWRARK